MPVTNAPGAAAAPATAGDMTTTASGLKYQVLKHGTGTVSPKATDTVKVHYEGKLLDGTVFDSSIARGQPISFPLNASHPRLDGRPATDESGRQVQVRDSGEPGLRRE